MKMLEVRVELQKLRDQLDVLIAETYRRKPLSRAPATARPMTVELADKIRAIHKDHPDMSQRAIGNALNINSGRVSEVLRGKRQ